MAEAYIIDGVRTPVGRRGGGLAAVPPADLGAHVIRALLARTQADPSDVDDVIFGCVDTVGPQAGDIARTAWPAAGLPEAVPGVTVDRQCGSSQQAAGFAAQAVLSGTADLIVAGGVQNMSMVPIAAAMGDPFGDPFSGSRGWRERYGSQEISQFRAADLIASKWAITRAEMEDYALASHQKAIGAIDGGRFTAEIAPYRPPRNKAPRDKASRNKASRNKASRNKASRDRSSRTTSARGATPLSRRWPRSARCGRTAGSPPRCPARSRTARPPC